MNPDKTTIAVEQIGKKFSRSLKRSIQYGFADIARNLVGLPSPSDRLRAGEMWAVEDISFTVKQGEAVGIIGSNGAGKSTLLKMLNGIYPPDRGRIRIQGRVAGLIELGAGFHPMLTGTENIYNNGVILGLTKREVDERFEDIARFADIGEALNSPVKYYSSGMYARLGFAVAIHTDPDVLLVDEVLSVGDASFRSKCYERILAFQRQGKTICFVSHDLMGVNAICSRVLWLNSGRVEMTGSAEEVIPAYLESEDRRNRQRAGQKQGNTVEETAEIIITQIETIGRDGLAQSDLRYRERLLVRVHYKASQPVSRPYFMIYVYAGVSPTAIFSANMLRDGGQPELLAGEGWLDIDFGELQLYPGVYRIRGMIRKNSNVEYFSSRELASFQVVSLPEEYGRHGTYVATYIRDGTPMVMPVQFTWGNRVEAEEQVVNANG